MSLNSWADAVGFSCVQCMKKQMALVLLMAMYLNYMCLLIKTKVGTAVKNESCLKGKQGYMSTGRNDTMTGLRPGNVGGR